MNTRTLQGHWKEIKGKVREKWSELTDDELGRVQGNYEQLVGLIERKTGTARSQIERYLSGVLEDGSTMVQQVAETAQEYAGQAADAVRSVASSAADAAWTGIKETNRMVKRHPMESLAVCFSVGLIAGALVGLTIRSR